MKTKSWSKISDNIANLLFLLISVSIAFMVAVCLILFGTTLYLFLKPKVLSVLEYLGLESIWSLFVLLTSVSLLIYITIYSFYKKNKIKKINNYLIISIYLIILSLSSSVIIMYSLIPNDIIFDKEIELKNRITDESFKIGNIKCTSESFAFVKGESTPCVITAEIPKSILADKPNTEFTEIVITQNFVDTKMYSGQGEYKESSNSSQSMSYRYSLKGNKLSNRSIPLDLLEKDFINLTFYIKTSSNAHFILVNRNIILVNRDIAVSKNQQTNNLIYTLLLFSMSFSVLAIFGGINSLRQIIQYGNTEQHKQKKVN